MAQNVCCKRSNVEHETADFFVDVCIHQWLLPGDAKGLWYSHLSCTHRDKIDLIVRQICTVSCMYL